MFKVHLRHLCLAQQYFAETQQSPVASQSSAQPGQEPGEPLQDLLMEWWSPEHAQHSSVLYPCTTLSNVMQCLQAHVTHSPVPADPPKPALPFLLEGIYPRRTWNTHQDWKTGRETETTASRNCKRKTGLHLQGAKSAVLCPLVISSE